METGADEMVAERDVWRSKDVSGSDPEVFLIQNPRALLSQEPFAVVMHIFTAHPNIWPPTSGTGGLSLK